MISSTTCSCASDNDKSKDIGPPFDHFLFRSRTIWEFGNNLSFPSSTSSHPLGSGVTDGVTKVEAGRLDFTKAEIVSAGLDAFAGVGAELSGAADFLVVLGIDFLAKFFKSWKFISLSIKWLLNGRVCMQRIVW